MKLRIAIFGILTCCALRAETGRDAWLRYAKLDRPITVPDTITVLGTNALEQSARDEVIRGVKGLLGKDLKSETTVPKAGTILLGTLAEIRAGVPRLTVPAALEPDGFWLKNATVA